MNELEQIVQRMIDANEPEEAIAAVIKEYNSNKKTEEGKTSTTEEDTTVDVTEVSEVMESPSEDGSLGLEETKYKTPLTREEKIALQNNRFVKQMSKEDNFTKERLKELQDEVDFRKNNVTGLADYLGTALNKGDKFLGEALFSTPGFLYSTAALISDPINRALGLPETDVEKFEESIGTRPVIESLIDEQNRLGDQLDLYEKEKGIEGGAYDNFKQGQVSDGFVKLGRGLAESAPVSISMMMGGFAGASRVSMMGVATPILAGPELKTQREENPEQSELENVLKATGMAGAESFFEGIGKGTIGKVYRDIIFKEGKEQGSKIFRNGLVEMYETAIKRFGVPATLVGGGIEEVATTITQNLIDEKPTFQNVGDSFVQGVGGGSVYGAPVNISKSVDLVKNVITETKINSILNKSSNFELRGQGIEFAFNPSQKVTESQIEISKNKNSYKVLDNKLKRNVLSGTITNDQADAIRINFKQTQGTVNSLSALRLQTKDQASAVQLIKEKKQLTEEIKQVGESNLTIEQSDRIKEIDNDLRGIGSKAVTQEVEKVKKAAESIKDLDVQEFASTEETEAFLNEQGQDSKASGQQGFIIQNPKTGKQTIVINREVADREIAVAAPSHEFLHALLFSTVKNSPETQIALGNSLKEYINSIDANKVKDSNFAKRLEQYKSDPDAVQAEEVLTLFSDAIRTEDIKFNEDVFTKIGDVVRKALQALGVKVKFNNGKDVYNFIKDYNKSLESTGLTKAQIKVAEGVTGKLVADKVQTDEQIIKESRSEEASTRVQELYDTQGEAAAFDIIEQFKPITSKIVEKRSEAPGFDRQLLTDEIETGKRGILDLIKEYKPESGVPLAAYINKFLPARAIEASRRILGEEFTDDVTEAKGVAAEEVSIDVTPTDKSTTSKLRRVLGIKQDDAIYDLAKEVSGEILSGDLPGKKVKTAINKEARKSKLRKAVSDLMGTEKAIDEQFLNKNILEILKALPASDLVKLEREAKVKVLAEQGPRLNVKDAREAVNKGLLPKDTNLQSGPKVSSKLPTTLEQAKEFFTQKRKAGLVNVVTEMLVKDAAPEVTKDKMEPAKRAKVLSEIDRAPELKFSKSNLTKEQLNLVKQQQGEIFQRFVSSDLSVKSMRLILSDVLEDAGVSDETISKYAQELTSPAKKFIVDLKKQLVTESDFGEVTNEQIEQALSAITLKSLLGIDVNPGGAFDVTEYLNKFRKLQHEYQLEQIKKLGNLDGIISILKFHKDYHTSAGKIGDGRYQGYAGSLDWFKATNEALKDKKIEIKYKETGTGVVPVNVTINGVEQFKNQAELKAKIKTFSQSNNLKRETVEAEYDARKKEAGEGFDAMVDYLGFISSKGDKLQFGMSLMALKSNMSALGKRVAYVKYFYNGKSDSATVFEHMLPSLYTLKEMVKNFYEGGVDLEALKESQQVAMIPRDMDKRINIVHQASMPSWFKLGMSPLTRYFNALTKGYKNMFALESIGGKDKGVVYGEDYLALNNSVLKASKSNNNILPSELKLKGDFINNSVLNEMSDIDNNSQTEELKFSKSLDLNKDFNDIIENKTGIASDKTYARVKAEVAGANKGKFNFFIPPSAEDFVGLLYSTLGKGSIGDAQMAWYKAHLLNPFARAMENVANDRAAMMQDFRGLKKALKIVPKDLRRKIPGEPFTKEQAVRAYIWDKQGMNIPGLSQKDQKDLVDYIKNDSELIIFADQLIDINKGDAYAAPDDGWIAGTIDTDFLKALNTTKRSKYLEVWQQNVDQIFSETNLNKLEAAYGKPYRVAMENILHRMETGRNRSFGTDTITGRFTDWLTNSVGAIMFFNTRSAVLQTISAVNFINFSDNNPLKAGQAFANQPQYWSDFKKLFNSPFLLDRRSGIKLNVNEADIAEMAKGPGNSARNVIAGLLKIGFLPTQLADSFAIASGGASFYRNRIKALKKEGLTDAEAEETAFRDFREIAEESQQSSRPDKISQQQAGPLGRIVLAFANTPAQYARLIKKAASDLKNRRGDAKTNISKIIYYGVAQNILFSALQQALFAISFGDEDDEEEKRNEKYFNIANGMSDSILRGIGVGGAIASVVKNTAIRLAKEADKKAPKYQDAVVKGVLQISPPISSKVGKLQSAGRSLSWNKKEMMTKGWAIDNPAYLASANVISAITNVPLDRAVKKVTNLVDASNEETEYYKRIALALGWSAWELDIEKENFKKNKPKSKPKRKRTSSTKRRK